MKINDLIGKAHRNAVNHGFWEEVDIDRTLMLIISEIGELIEAERSGRYGSINEFEKASGDFTSKFERCIKDTFEDEIADVFIRIFDLMGYLEIEYQAGCLLPNIGLYRLLKMVTEGVIQQDFVVALWCLESLCQALKLDIEPFILYKMEYNASRPYKHGKKY